MNSSVTISDGVGSFPALTELGIANGFTFDNTVWGNLRRDQQVNWEKYQKLLTTIGGDSTSLAYLGVENNDSVQTLTAANWEIYHHFATRQEPNKGQALALAMVDGDALITDQPISLLLTPADCAGIVLTAQDQKSKKRFVTLVHSGLYGMQLDILSKALQLAHLNYTFANEELHAFVFPHISGRNYRHRKETWQHHSFINIAEWEKYFIDLGDDWGVDFSRKIFDDLQALRIGQICESGLDTYDENKEGRLFSQTYNRQHNPDGLLLRFGVMVQLLANK